MKILCIGRNYAAHAAELNNPVPDEPVIFLKPDSALLENNADFPYPDFSNSIHYECELVLRVGKQGRDLHPADTRAYLDGVGLGIDFTARDLQSTAKEKGLPWAIAKGFHGAAPVSEMQAIEKFAQFDDIHYTCEINGETRQKGHTALMLFPIPNLVTHLSRFFTLQPGDLIFTGTPKGVGAVERGDLITGSLEGQQLLNFYVR